MVVGDGSDEAGFVHPFGGIGKMLADLQAWQRGCDGFEFPTNFCGGLGFHVKHIHMAGPAQQIE